MTFPQDMPIVKTVPLKWIRERDSIPDPDYFKKPHEQTAKKIEGPAQNAILKEKK